jgi:uroporphyrinogen-III decarboxylase
MVWFGDLTYWYAAHSQMEDLPERWRGERGIGRVHRDMNVGEYVPGCCAYAEHCEVEVVRSGEHDARVTEWRTPLGSLRQVSEYCPTSFSCGIRAHPAKSVADLAIVRHIAEHRTHRPCYEEITRLDQEVGDYGLPVVAIAASPMGELYKEWTGLMNLSYLLADEPKEVRWTLDTLAACQDEPYRITAESPCEYVMLCENFSAETMGGLFDLYTRDYLQRRIDYLHQHGKKCIVHVDGTLRGLAEKLPAIGVDCLDAVTPKPVGDVGLDEIRKLVGDEILILGGLPGAMFAPPFTAKEMEQHVLEIIRLHKESGRFMFGVADQVPPNGDINLVKLVADLIDAYGRY